MGPSECESVVSFASQLSDDETLFGSFTILRYKPHVIVCLRSQVQEMRGGPAAGVRETETGRALWWLGSPSWEQWHFSDVIPDWDAMGDKLHEHLKATAYDIIFCPAWEPDGHDQHNGLAELVAEVAAYTMTKPYLTYRRGSMRSRSERQVSFEEGWIERKLRALSVYSSQHSAALGTLPWFMDDTLREFYA